MRIMLAFATAAIAHATSVDAQAVRGRITDNESQDRVSGAVVSLLDTRGKERASSKTDNTGTFEVFAPSSGSYQLRVSRIGYSVFLSEPLELSRRETTHVAIKLSAEPLALSPLVVTARSQSSGRMAEFEKRRARLGTGYYITQEQIEARPIATTSSLLLGVPGVVLRPTRFGGDMITMHGGALGCIATVYVDGMRVEGNVDDFLVPQWIGAIEVYSRAALAPTEYSKGNCGVVLLWTREPEKGGRWTAPKIAAIGGLLAFVGLVAR